MLWDEAIEEAADRLEAEAWRRGVDGVEEPVISMGKPVMVEGKLLTKRVYSDHLLLAQLKAHRPARYRENVRVDVAFDIGDRLQQALRYLDSTTAQVIDGVATTAGVEDKSA